MYQGATSVLTKYLRKEDVSPHVVEAAQPFFVGLLKAWQDEHAFSREQEEIFAGFDVAAGNIPALAAFGSTYTKLRLKVMFQHLEKYRGDRNALPLQFLQEVQHMHEIGGTHVV